MTIEETIQTTVISQCGECDAEIMRTQKEYSLKYFNELNNIQPNYRYKNNNDEYFMIVRSICDDCCK